MAGSRSACALLNASPTCAEFCRVYKAGSRSRACPMYSLAFCSDVYTASCVLAPSTLTTLFCSMNAARSGALMPRKRSIDFDTIKGASMSSLNLDCPSSIPKASMYRWRIPATTPSFTGTPDRIEACKSCAASANPMRDFCASWFNA